MFFFDDLLLRMLGISIPGLDLISNIEIIKDFAYRELYNIDKIKNKIKENQMLYEFDELSTEEYEERKTELMRQLKFAERVLETNLNVRTDILH
ncbi:MAG: hypothetical protein PHG79_05395 [Methanosarcina sp.]|nr:hypothetical protein [Methanosarcina sp.]MDD4522541.1 hypothetical protein [Methanosarcina sp.]